MAGQTSLTKADVEFANLSDYAVSVHLLGASFRQDGALSHPRFCQERRHFSILAEFPPPLLPVDSGYYFTADFCPTPLLDCEGRKKFPAADLLRESLSNRMDYSGE